MDWQVRFVRLRDCGHEVRLAFPSLLSSLQLDRTAWTRRDLVENRRRSADSYRRSRRAKKIYTIFEGTSEIQRLVIARSISGIRIP